MTEDGARRDPRESIPPPAARHGHRKISAALAAYASGEVLGRDLAIWSWDQFAAWAASHGVVLSPMTQDIAAGLFAAASFLAFYVTREEP